MGTPFLKPVRSGWLDRARGLELPRTGTACAWAGSGEIGYRNKDAARVVFSLRATCLQIVFMMRAVWCILFARILVGYLHPEVLW